MVGTAVTLVTRSRSMTSRAASESHLRISTTVPPAHTCETSPEWHPVPWKSETGTRTTGGGAALGERTPARIAPRAATNCVLTTLAHMLRCVPRTPFGWLVVPDV
jgi:hypothetical protein